MGGDGSRTAGIGVGWKETHRNWVGMKRNFIPLSLFSLKHHLHLFVTNSALYCQSRNSKQTSFS